MLDVANTINLFVQPVSATYPNILKLQTILLRIGSTISSPSLAAIRCLDVFSDSDLFGLMMESVSEISIVNPTETDLMSITSADAFARAFTPYRATVTQAVKEATAFLPEPTARIVFDYNTLGEPLTLTSVASFLILAANLQDT